MRAGPFLVGRNAGGLKKHCSSASLLELKE
jgi:hypothetical protein